MREPIIYKEYYGSIKDAGEHLLLEAATTESGHARLEAILGQSMRNQVQIGNEIYPPCSLKKIRFTDGESFNFIYGGTTQILKGFWRQKAVPAHIFLVIGSPGGFGYLLYKYVIEHSNLEHTGAIWGGEPPDLNALDTEKHKKIYKIIEEWKGVEFADVGLFDGGLLAKVYTDFCVRIVTI